MLVQVITGTTRQGRFSERVAAWVIDRLSQRDDMTVELVDLRDHPLPFFDGAAPARTGREYTHDDVARFGQVVDRADGYIILTAEYYPGYPGVLKNAMDWTFVEWRRKPIIFVGWGNVGGARAIEQLRQVAVEYEMAPLRFAVHVLPDIMIAARPAAGTARRRPCVVDRHPRWRPHRHYRRLTPQTPPASPDRQSPSGSRSVFVTCRKAPPSRRDEVLAHPPSASAW